MTEIDPMEGSSHNLNHILKIEVEVEEDETFNETYNAANYPQDLVFNNTEVTVDPTTGLLICLLCLEDLQTDTVTEHMVTVHKYRKVAFKCWNCGTVFEERSDLMSHRKFCEPKKRKKRTVKQLMREADAVNNHYCPICLIEVDNLREHSAREHLKSMASAECQICKKVFKTKITLSQHVKLVHQSIQNSAECETCGQKFASPKYLQNHVRNVHPPGECLKGDKVHKCAICGKEYKSHQSVYQHIKNVHPETISSKVHNCEYCEKVFKSHQSLYHHKKNVHWKKKKPEEN